MKFGYIRSVRLRAMVIGFCIVTATLYSSNSSAETITYNPEAVKEKEQLISALLRLALSYTDPKIKVEAFHERLPGSRAQQYVEDDKLTIWWAGASQAREESMLPVYIPVLKGLVGHRLFIIHKGTQHKFDSVNSLDDLKQLKAGQGRTWGDAQVLKAASLPMETATKTINLFYMLDGGRFDYFPRSAHEPWAEIEKYSNLDLTVEKGLVLIYPQPMYFYVNKSNKSLHRKIAEGLEMAIADGTYDELFFNHPMVRGILKAANLKDRRVVRISNPLLTSQAPLDRPELWLNLHDLHY